MAREAQNPDPARPADAPMTTINRTIGVELDDPGNAGLQPRHAIAWVFIDSRFATSVPPVFA
jgi:hypothetical protein